MGGGGGDKDERVRVVVRARPMNTKESREKHDCVVNVNQERGEVEITRPLANPKDVPDTKIFFFDSSYDGRTSQKELYKVAFEPLVNSVLEGFNGTIFAYGQTGTGKTYTMQGDLEKESEQGVIPNAFRHIFEHVSANSKKQFMIRASYLEIYQEEIRDLLGKDLKQNRELRESPAAGVYVKDLSSHLCRSFEEINDLMSRGNKNRAVGATNMNEHSSRSHAIFMVTIEMSEKLEDGRDHFRVGKLNLVDLAGSERQGKTGAVGERFKEATKINLSLSALGNVIAALVDGKSSHIPYRDSKLTRLLQDSLGGNSRTIMVATVGPSAYNWEETITTLRYASRAKKIKNKPKVNEDPKDALLREYQEEIARLRKELEKKRANRALMLQNQDPNQQPSSEPKKNRKGGKNSAESLKRAEERQAVLNELNEMLKPFGLDASMDPKYIMEKVNEHRQQKENQEVLSKLTETELLMGSGEEECRELNERIQWLESKVLHGGGDLLQHTREQQKLIEEKQRELAEQTKRYEETKKRLQQEKMAVQELRNQADGMEFDNKDKAKKIRKMVHKCHEFEAEVEEVQDIHIENLRELEQILIDIKREFSMNLLLLANFIPPLSRDLVERMMDWDDEKETFTIDPNEATHAIRRPFMDQASLLPSLLHTYDGILLIMRNSPLHYEDENVLQLHPPPPPERTMEYIPPVPPAHPVLSSLMKKLRNTLEKPLSIRFRYNPHQSHVWRPRSFKGFNKGVGKR